MLRSRIKTVPLDTCSWAVLPPSDGRKRSREELGFEFERFLPHPIEHYAVDFARQSDGSCVALGVARDIVRGVQSTHDSVRPESVPAFLSQEVSADAFELARGQLTPTRILKLQRLTAALTAIAVVGASLLLTIGLLTRTSHLVDDAATLRSLADNAYVSVLPSDTPASQPRSILVQGLLRQSRQATATAADLSMPDARFDLAAVLAAWPADQARLRQLSIDRDTATIEILLGADADAAPLLESFESIPGWQPSAPAVRRTGSDQRVTIRLIRAAEEPSS